MLTRLQVANYRAIGPGPVALDLAPLTVLVGPNGAGKSALLEALALTAQSATEDLSRHELVLDGTRVRTSGGPTEASRLAALHHRRAAELPMSVSIDHDPTLGPRAYDGHRPTADRVIRYYWERQGGPRPRWIHSLKHGPLQAVARAVDAVGGVQYEIRVTAGKDVVIERPVADAERVLPRWQLLGDAVSAEARDSIERIESSREVLRRSLSEVLLLSALRGDPLVQRQTGPRVTSVGRHGESTIRLLSQVLRQEPEYKRLAAQLEGFGLPALEAGVFEGDVLRAVFRDPTTDRSWTSHRRRRAHNTRWFSRHSYCSARRSRCCWSKSPRCTCTPRTLGGSRHCSPMRSSRGIRSSSPPTVKSSSLPWRTSCGADG